MSALFLKIIATILMVIDHIGFFFPYITPLWFRIVGRASFPIFMFLFVEGYINTSNKKAYFYRLSKYSLLMLFLNIFSLTMFKIFNMPTQVVSPFVPNIFLTFSVCFVILNRLDNLFKKRRITIICNNIFILLILISLSAFIEYDIYAISTLLIFYIFRTQPILRNVLFFCVSIYLPVSLNNPIQSAMLLSIILFSEYNGSLGYKKTNKKFTQLFFYNFYIIHIFILNIISAFFFRIL